MKKTITRIAICGIGLGLLLSAGCATRPYQMQSTEPPKEATATKEAATDSAAPETAKIPAADPAPAQNQPIPEIEPPVTKQVVAQTIPTVYKYAPDSTQSLGTEKQLSEFCREIAGKIYYELKQSGSKHLTSRVAVVDAVPLSDLKRETEFGRLVSEYLLTDLADRGLRVTELRLGKEINILPQTGEFILSRNIGELATDSPMLDYVLVSTFTNTRKTLILQGRLVSLKSGLVETSWRYTLPLNRELLGLFHTPEQPFTIAVNGMNR